MESPSFTKLTMDTITNASGEAKVKIKQIMHDLATNIPITKVGNKLNKSSVSNMDDEEPGDSSLHHINISSDILDEEDIEQIRERLPTRLENNEWTLAFSTARLAWDEKCPIGHDFFGQQGGGVVPKVQYYLSTISAPENF